MKCGSTCYTLDVFFSYDFSLLTSGGGAVNSLVVGQATSATIIQSPGGVTRRANVNSQSDEGMSLIVQLGTTVVSKTGSSVTSAAGIRQIQYAKCIKFSL